MKTFLIIFSAFLLLLSICVCGSFGAAVSSASAAGSLKHPAHLLTRKFNKTKAFCGKSDCSSTSDCTTECGNSWSCNIRSICEYESCVGDRDCLGSNSYCYFGTCRDCPLGETWNGYMCNECTDDYQCLGSNSYCYIGTCYNCYGDESWDGYNCEDLSGFLGLAIGLLIFFFVGIPLIIAGCIVACCFCCPGCPGHNCRQRRNQQAQQQTYFVTAQNPHLTQYPQQQSPQQQYPQQQYPQQQQQSEPRPNPEARY